MAKLASSWFKEDHDREDKDATGRREIFLGGSAKYRIAFFVFAVCTTAHRLYLGSTTTPNNIPSFDTPVASASKPGLNADTPKKQARSLTANATTTNNTPAPASSIVGASPRLPKTLVIYFPQYHRDPVNDRNWGDGFTDWDSLRGTPSHNKIGQQIPRPLEKVPSNTSGLPPLLGYYDLTDKEARETHGILAKKYGIDGFIYHHYWFYDKSSPGPTLAKPLEKMLEDGHPDVPFMLNWCAVKWVNVWMGKAIFQTIPTNKKRAITLQEQYFKPTQDEIYQHYLWLKPFFNHPNYIRVDGQPAFLLYSYDDQALPILESLRRFAREDGFPGLHFIAGRSSYPEELYNPSHLLDDHNMLHQCKRRNLLKDVDPTQTESRSRSIFWPTLPPRSKSGPAPIVKYTWDYNPINQTMTYPYPLELITKPFEVPAW